MMPLYDCRCEGGHLFERQIPLDNFDDPIICGCGMVARRLISRPRILRSMDYSYDCPVTGKHITSKHAHEENLKRTGCRVRETNESEYRAKERAKAEEAFDRQVEATVERQIDNMSGEKRELLGKAFTSGLDADISRI